MSKYDELGQPGEPDFWEPKTKTEREILKGMEEARRLRPLMSQWMGSKPTSNELKEIRIDRQWYHDLRRRGYTHESHPDLDLEMLLEKVRRSIVTFEDMAEQPGKEFYRGIMDATCMFLMDIIHLHEAKKKLKRELEEGA